MKKHSTIILFLASAMLTRVVAASPTPLASASATPAKAAASAAIDDLKERLATKVAELRTSQKKAIFGKVKSVSVSTLTVETTTNEVKLELTDDIKVYQYLKGKRTSLTTDDLSKDDTVVVFGDYDASLDLLKAKVIFIQSTLPRRISGTITAVDKKEFTVTMSQPDGKSYVIDIEKNTAVLGYSPAGGVIKSGFSKMEPGEIIHAVGTLQPKTENRMSGMRILDIGRLSDATPTPTPTAEATPTASASATPKAKITAKTTPSATPTRAAN